MKILIVGAGRTGCSLIEALARKNYDITIIEKDKKTVEAINRFGSSRNVQSG